jgi:hypothetical protein
MFYVTVRQNSKVEHSVTLPIDVITSASTDAIDATTSASRHNEAGTLQIETRVDASDDDTLSFVYGGHGEEWFASVFGGLGYTRDLAEDNATVSVRVDGSFDWFKPYGPHPGGVVPEGKRFDLRGGVSGNVEVFQILSPTAWVKAGYGIRWRKGALLTPWNSVPFLCDPEVTACLARVQEKFPRTRLMQTVSGLVAQHLPKTKTTLRASYRFYADDYDVRAHSMLGEIYQYVTERAYIKGHYRAHHQTAVFFWTSNLGLADLNLSAPRTSDSDLARFWAHEWGVKTLFHLTPPRSQARAPTRRLLQPVHAQQQPERERRKPRRRLQFLSIKDLCARRQPRSGRPVRSRKLCRQGPLGFFDDDIGIERGQLFASVHLPKLGKWTDPAACAIQVPRWKQAPTTTARRPRAEAPKTSSWGFVVATWTTTPFSFEGTCRSAPRRSWPSTRGTICSRARSLKPRSTFGSAYLRTTCWSTSRVGNRGFLGTTTCCC